MRARLVLAMFLCWSLAPADPLTNKLNAIHRLEAHKYWRAVVYRVISGNESVDERIRKGGLLLVRVQKE